MNAAIEYLNSISPLLLGIEIIIVSISFALITDLISKKILQPLLKKTSTELDDYFFSYAVKGIFWTIILAGFYFGLPYLDIYHPSQIYKKIIFSYVVLVWAWVIAQIALVFFENLIEKYINKDNQSKKGMLGFLKRVSVFFIASVVIAIIFVIWEINITPILASAGVAGVAIGFAAKDTVSNFFGGISVFFDHPYKVGDYVIIKDKYRGEVIKIGTRSTKIKTRDNVLLTIPNSVMITGVVVNETGHDNKLRIRIPLGVSYNSDLDKVEKILTEIIKSNSSIISPAKRSVLYRKFGPSAVNLEVMGILNKPANKGPVIHELIKSIHQRFEEEKIIMPAPQREVKLIK